MAVEVVVDVYSGRENPKCTLDVSAIQELGQQLRRIQEKKTNQLPHPPALGYRGLHLNATDETLPPRMTIFDGVVQTESANFHDPKRKIEKWLIRKCRSAVDAATYRYLQSALQGE